MAFDIQGKIGQAMIAGAQHALIKARGDGNCLFHAAGHELLRRNLVLPAHDTHATFRAHVVAYVEAHAKDTNALGFKLRDGLGINRNALGAVTAAQGLQIDARVAYLRTVTHWGDEACITAIEQLYNVQVLVYDNLGLDQNALGVPYYTPHRGPGNELRLCVQLIGALPYHYDLWLPDALYDAARDGPDRTAPEAPKPVVEGEGEPKPKKPPAPKGPPPKEWDYALAADGLKPYGAPIAHQQFAYTAAWLEGRAVARAKKPLSVALGDQPNSSAGPPAPVIAVQLVTQVKGKEGARASRSWAAAPGKEAFALGYREPFFMPLQRRDGVCVDVLDPGNTELVIEIAAGKRAPARLYGALHNRAATVADFELDLSGMEGKPLDSGGPARVRYTIPAGTVIDVKLRKFLTWEGAPYQLVLSSAEDLAVEASAWTYFQVPSDWEINAAEAVGAAPILMLKDDARPLADTGIAAVREVANLNLEGEKPTGREEFDFTAEEHADTVKLLTAVGQQLNQNTTSYLVERRGGYYVNTSWASMVHLVRDKEGGYSMDALYCSGGGRTAYLISVENRESTPRRAAAGEAYARHLKTVKDWSTLVERYQADVSRLRSELANAVVDAQRYVQAQGQVKMDLMKAGTIKPTTSGPEIDKLVAVEMAKLHPRLVKDYKPLDKAKRDAIAQFQPPCDKSAPPANAALQELHRNVELRDFLRVQKIVVEVPAGVTWNKDQLARCDEEATLAVKALAAINTRLHALRKDAAFGGLELEVTDMVEGVKDFDPQGNSCPKGKDWKRYLFLKPIKVTHAVTAGISSCAGGITVTTEEAPEHIFLWHVDGPVSIPLRAELERLWPGGKGLPDLRSVVSINPTLWELNKYRPENLYPADALARCRTAYLPRSSHLYGYFPMSAGSQLFGVDCSDRDPAMVFTYDLEMRAEPLSKTQSAPPAAIPRILVDFQANLYGADRDEGDKVEDPAAMSKYIAKVTGGPASALNAIKHRRRRNMSKACRLPGLSAARLDVLIDGATPLLTTDCFYAGDKGDLELFGGKNVRWAPGPYL